MRIKLLDMLVGGELTPYLYSRCESRIAHLPVDMQEQMIKDASIMSAVGVNSEDDQKHFMYISMHLKSIANDIMGRTASQEELAKISSIIYNERNVYTIDTIFNFYKAASRAMEKLNLPIKKVAYPMEMNGIMPENPHDVSKWMNALREIYARVHRGMDYQTAFNKVTANWEIMEQQDFKAWNRYYAENTQDKYKTAQISDYYQAEDGSPLLPFKDLKSTMPGMSGPNHMDLPPHIADEKKRKEDEKAVMDAQKRESIQDTRKKLLSRLTSAERLATEIAGQEDINEAIDMGLNKWLEMLHALKRSIQTAPIKNARSPILHDLIVRRGNQLKHEGYAKSAALLITLAQEAPKAPPVEELEGGTENPMAEMEGMGDLKPIEEPDGAMDDFVKMLNHEHLGDSDEADDLDSDDLVVEAQALPEPPPAPPMPAPEAEMGDMEQMMGEPADIEVEDAPQQGDTLDMALENIQIEDVINRLEMVANIIQNREIPRQLSFVDMQMGKLGIATFFPSIGEAIRSALESHQYMYTRIEDTLAKLRGSVEPEQKIDLVSDQESEQATSETLEAVRDNLERTEEEDRARAEARKAKREAREDKENAPAAPEEPEAPAITPEEIAGPVEVESAPPTRAT